MFMMRMVVAMIMSVIVIVMRVIVVFVPMTVRAFMVVIVIMRVVVAAVALWNAHGEQVEQGQHHQADAGDQHHRSEYTIWGQILGDAPRGIKVKHDGTPKQQQGDTDQVG